jgi:hypothetical protein
MVKLARKYDDPHIHRPAISISKIVVIHLTVAKCFAKRRNQLGSRLYFGPLD